MKVIIPVAGEGRRLRPHTYTTPKALLPVAGKPILGHIIDQILDLDISEVIFITGPHGDKIEKYVKDNYVFPRPSSSSPRFTDWVMPCTSASSAIQKTCWLYWETPSSNSTGGA